MLGEEAFKVAVLCGELFPKCTTSGAMDTHGVRSTCLPDGKFLHVLPPISQLFPGEYTTCSFVLLGARGMILPTTFDVMIRVFTDAGIRDFPLKFQCSTKAP